MRKDLRRYLEAEQWKDLVRLLSSDRYHWEDGDPELALECWLAIERAGFATMEESFQAAWARWSHGHGPRARGRKEPEDLLALGHRMVDFMRFAGRTGDPAPGIQRRVVELARKILGDDVITARALNALGALHEARGEWSEAEARYLEALAMFEATVGCDDIDTAIILNNLSNLWIDLGRLAEATEAHERYARIWDRIHGPEAPERVTRLNRTAMILLQNEDLDGGLAVAREAYDLATRVLDEHDPDWLTSCSNLGALLVMSRKQTEARGYLAKVLEVTERVCGAAHPKTASALYNLASLMLEQEDADGALAYFRRARAILMNVAQNHVDLVNVEEQISLLLILRSDFIGAAEHLQRSVDIREEWMGEDHPEHCPALELLCDLYSALDEPQKALATELRFERIKRGTGGWDEGRDEGRGVW